MTYWWGVGDIGGVLVTYWWDVGDMLFLVSMECLIPCLAHTQNLIKLSCCPFVLHNNMLVCSEDACMEFPLL